MSRHLSFLQPLSVAYRLTYSAATQIIRLGHLPDNDSTRTARGIMEMHRDNNKFFINKQCVSFIKQSANEERNVNYSVGKC